MEITLELTGGETLVARPAPGDFVRFERHFDLPISVLDDPRKVRIDHTLFLAWSALKRTQQYAGTYDELLDRLEAFPEAEREGKAPQPE